LSMVVRQPRSYVNASSSDDSDMYTQDAMFNVKR
jgi:hypothetical protein